MISAFPSFFSVNHGIQILNVHLEAFAESRVGQLSFPDQITH
jgi:hypothetical protein